MCKNRVLIFMASPKKNGYTMEMCNNFINGIGSNSSVEIVFPYDEEIQPCTDCKYCRNVKMKCRINDSMAEIYDKIDKADIILIASPMYFCSFPSPMKHIIDRSQVYWSNKYIFNDRPNKPPKTGILIACAGIEWENMFISMECTAKYFFKCIGAEMKHVIYLNNTDKLSSEHYQYALEKCFQTGTSFNQ